MENNSFNLERDSALQGWIVDQDNNQYFITDKALRFLIKSLRNSPYKFVLEEIDNGTEIST